MKKILNLLAIVAAFSLTVLMSCGEDPPKKKEPISKKTAEALEAGTWTPDQVTLDNTPREEWGSFQLNFTVSGDDYFGGNYSAQGLPTEDEDQVTWKPSGTWTFGGTADAPDILTIIRDDGVVMDLVVSVTESGTGTCSLSFTIEEPAARVEGFYGDWVFGLSF